MTGLEPEEIRAPAFACGRHCCFLCLGIEFGDPGQSQGTGPGPRTFLQRGIIARLFVQTGGPGCLGVASPVVLGDPTTWLEWKLESNGYVYE